MPEQNGLGAGFAARFEPGDDLTNLTVKTRFANLAGFDMRPQRTQMTGTHLPQIVHDELIEAIHEIERQCAHGAIGHDQCAGANPRRLKERLGPREPRCLDLDVGTHQAAFPIIGRHHGLAKLPGQPRGEGVATFRPSRVNADLVEIKEMIEQPHIPIGRPSRPDMTKDTGVLRRQVFRTQGRERARPHVSYPRRINDGLWYSRLRAKKVEQRHLRRQSLLIVVDIVPHHFDAGIAERSDIAAENIEMAVDGGIRCQMEARLNNGLTTSGRHQSRLDRIQDFVIAERQASDIGATQVLDLKSAHFSRLRTASTISSIIPGRSSQQTPGNNAELVKCLCP